MSLSNWYNRLTLWPSIKIGFASVIFSILGDCLTTSSGILSPKILFHLTMKVKRFVFVLGVILTGCSQDSNPQFIIDKTIEKHGGEKYENFKAEFDFRGRHYVLEHNKGHFQYERHFTENAYNVEDILNNQGFKRYLNGVDVTDTVKKAAAYSRSVNSVAYFALLPYRLNDPAVNKIYLGREEIKGQPYHKVQVTFDAEGGGEDYTDEFVYWIHQDHYTMDYLAYLYYTDGGGKRFRAPLQIHEVGGIRFADYENYQGAGDNTKIEEYARLYESGQLELLSTIHLENLTVE